MLTVFFILTSKMLALIYLVKDPEEKSNNKIVLVFYRNFIFTAKLFFAAKFSSEV